MAMAGAISAEDGRKTSSVPRKKRGLQLALAFAGVALLLGMEPELGERALIAGRSNHG